MWNILMLGCGICILAANIEPFPETWHLYKQPIPPVLFFCCYLVFTHYCYITLLAMFSYIFCLYVIYLPKSVVRWIIVPISWGFFTRLSWPTYSYNKVAHTYIATCIIINLATLIGLLVFHKAEVASLYISVGRSRLSGYLACMYSYFIIITISALKWDLW